MFKSLSFILLTFLSFNLCGSYAKGQGEGRSVCLLHDPPNQCGEFCLEALKPMLDHIAFHQKEWSTCGPQKLNETLEKLDSIKDQQKALKDYLSRLEQKEASLETKLDRIEQQLSALQETLSKPNNTKVSPLFVRIGQRLIYVEKRIRRSWQGAEETCLQMGGHLATIQDSLELNAIGEQLERSTSYWLGISDIAKEGEFVSVASGKPATFFRWKRGQPNNLNGNDHCVDMYNSEMYDSECTETEYFICEAVG
ncbi:accessory gland protein Acp29AB-like [Drosophila takahashii]|uniref:accessory gland protein Acp29AB-like n=1 Tax=Drosophila takahashii TaxID=29030 RepID=UPI001CF80514|nr:accessory gland protein Acp29AB-like [Drosophila takahashii]